MSLKNFKGKRVLLYFYPKDGTPGCTSEAIEFRDAIKEFEREDVVILGVSKDSIKSHLKFKQKHELPSLCSAIPKERSWISMECGRRKASMAELFWAQNEPPS